MEEQIQEVKVENKIPKSPLGKFNFKIFDKWDVNEVEVKDPGLQSAINLEPRLALKTHGRNVVRFGQTKVNIVERLMNKLSLAGHRGKKHKIEVGHSTGKYARNMGIVIEAFEMIEKKTGKNPIQVLVNALENAAPRDEVTMIEYGGARYPQAVDVSPIRRVNLSLRNFVHGASDKAFGKKKSFAQALADEIMLAADDNGESVAVKKKKEMEAQADSAR